MLRLPKFRYLQPRSVSDAIRMMGRVLGLLDALDRKLAQQAPHPRLGCASLHASLISGGQELSSYPGECRLQIERRTLPGESEAEIEAELRGVLEGLEKRLAATYRVFSGLEAMMWPAYRRLRNLRRRVRSRTHG